MEQEQQPVQPITQQQEIKEKVSRLRMLFKIAFICNICFLVCIIMRYSTATNYIPQPVVALTLILGWSAMFVNLLSFILALILLSRIRTRKVPLWLLYTNIVFFIAQFYFFFFLHD